MKELLIKIAKKPEELREEYLDKLSKTTAEAHAKIIDAINLLSANGVDANSLPDCEAIVKEARKYNSPLGEVVDVNHGKFIDCISDLPINADDSLIQHSLELDDIEDRNRIKHAYDVLYLLKIGFLPNQLKELGTMRAIRVIKKKCETAEAELEMAKLNYTETITSLINEI